MSRLSTKQRRARARSRSLRVFFDDYEWWAARDVEHARQLQREAAGLTDDEQAPADEWTEVPLTATVRWFDLDDNKFRERTWHGIVRELGGPGLIGGTEF